MIRGSDSAKRRRRARSENLRRSTMPPLRQRECFNNHS